MTSHADPPDVAEVPATAPGEPWAGHELVFVAGMHRSGTTLLADRIASLPGFAGLEGTGVQMNEGQFLQDVFPIGKQMGGVTRWARDPRAHLHAADAARTPDAARRLWQAWSPYWDLAAGRLVEKTPLNLTRLGFLQALFPRSRGVVITRHPVAQALAVSKWSPRRADRYGRGVQDLVEHWVLAHESFRASASELHDTHVLRFEHLVADPVQAARDLGAALGDTVPDDLLAGYDPARAHEYARRWAGARQPGAGRARVRAAVRSPRDRVALRDLAEAVLAPREAAAIRRRFGDRVGALGYDVDVLDRAEPWSHGS